MSYHTNIIVGFLGRDPEMRYTPGGQPVTNFSVAVDDSYTNSDGERIKRTLWFRVSAWGKLAEITNQYLQKGSPVLVEGKLVADESGNPRTYTKNDGTPGASFELRAGTVRFLGKKGDAPEDDGEAPAEPVEEDIPF